jgi:hypothetical protein
MAKKYQPEQSISWLDLKAMVYYNPESGSFKWLKKASKNTIIGSRIGRLISGGYIGMNLQKKLYLAHRLAWFYVYGRWPNEIDHINRLPADNRLCNLRECTRMQNRQNTIPKRSNMTGYKGVSLDKSRQLWRSRIKLSDRTLFLGRFKSAQEAAIAYDYASVKYFDKFAYTNFKVN